ncbi:hypothetical protein [Pseudarthrobacter sp. LT1]|uniref:hypothetical protein n=1 Tax=Pseudarthrobacter sp. LT1 TaxID=3111450 RepID=UPI002D78CA5E|nr:hypothetical protein [Pseudarthrobacter sp. LT1]WRT12509.1 hypothetical protein VIK36_14185 [Pseudarthrobacter sp. LT1]
MTHISDTPPLDPATRTDEKVRLRDEVLHEMTDGNFDRNSRSTTTADAHDIPALPSWTSEDYADFITGSGAAKLADSGVAPLVAAARGYARIDATNFTAEMKKMDLSLATKQGKRLKRCIVEADSDAMQMPWYSVADLQSADRRNVKVEPFTYQLRPAMPEDNEHGKPIKYEFKPKTGTPLDVHPAIPIDWIDTTPVVMFAEGMLKGDAAMSAYLHSQGLDWKELSFDDTFSAVKRMRKLLEAIPAADRVLIVSIAGINNAHQTPVDWREIDLKGREGWIAFDADLETNPFVHAAAKKLYEQLDEKSRMKTIKFLNPTVTSGDNGSMAKAGVDDYLATTGDWKMLLRQLTTNMPPAPARSGEERPGAIRVSKDGYSVEECVPINNGPNGAISGYRWDERVQLGGRVLSTVDRRPASDEELSTGVFDPTITVDKEDSLVYVEVSWKLRGVEDSAVVVIDDLAPSTVKRQAEAEDAKLTDITRAMFNNATKGRMNPGMTSQKVFKPVAQLIITAENELTTPSVKERLIPIYIGKGKLHPEREKTDRIVRMASQDGTQARFTSHVIRYIRHVASTYRGGWAGYMQHLEQVRDNVKFSVTDIMSELGASTGSLERTSTLASDVLLSLSVLQEMAIDLGMEQEFVDQFDVDGLCDSVIRLITDAHAENQQSAPGASLIRALSQLLAAGHAHVVAGDESIRPPLTGEKNEVFLNGRLGWKASGSDGSLRPMGPTIGNLVTAKDGGVILFEVQAAFAEAAKAFPSLVLPGQKDTSAWRSVWDEGLASTRYKRQVKKNGRVLNTVRPGNGAGRPSGVPVDVMTILNGGLDE